MVCERPGRVVSDGGWQPWRQAGTSDDGCGYKVTALKINQWRNKSYHYQFLKL